MPPSAPHGPLIAVYILFELCWLVTGTVWVAGVDRGAGTCDNTVRRPVIVVTVTMVWPGVHVLHCGDRQLLDPHPHPAAVHAGSLLLQAGRLQLRHAVLEHCHQRGGPLDQICEVSTGHYIAVPSTRQQ